MADKYNNAPYPSYPGGPPSAPPSAPNQMPGMPYPQYYPPPSYDAAMRGPQPPMPQQPPQMYGQMNPAQGYAPPPQQQPGFQVQPQPYYPPGMHYAQGGPMPQMPQGYGQPQQPQQPPAQAYYGSVAPHTAVFDSGARFNQNGSITVPPPPPGYMPTPAQQAAMNGQSVHVQKDKNNFFTGGKGAGFTFW